MSLHIVSELWSMVSDSLLSSDRDSIAEHLVSLLIDNDYTIDEIKNEFAHDKTIIQAVREYAQNEEDESEDSDDDWSDELDDDDDEW